VQTNEAKIRQVSETFRGICNSNCKEAELHEFLKQNLFLFYNSIEVHHPKGIYSKVCLGATYETDFVTYYDKTSGRYWVLIEIEPPNMPLFTKSGDPSRYLTHAIRQVTDWQSWIANNLAYARTFLTDILDPIGVVVIGRRDSLTEGNKRQLRQILRNNRQIEIMTYDRLIENTIISADMNSWYGLPVYDGKHLMQNPPPPPQDRFYESLGDKAGRSVDGLRRFGFGWEKYGAVRIINPNNEFNDSEEEILQLDISTDSDDWS